MNIVLPETKTSLLLNRNYQAFAVCTARAAIRHLMTGRVKGMDSEGNVVTWSGTELDTHGNSSLRWYNNEVGLYPDHPCLRSAPNHATGQDRAWAIPTIIVCTYHWGHHRRGTYNVSTRTLYKIYKGVCQYCLQKIPFTAATRDHAIPKSKGGTNDDFNLVLACNKCNNTKDDIHPYHDVNGKEVKSKRVYTLSFVPDGIPIRDEWLPFIHNNGTAI